MWDRRKENRKKESASAHIQFLPNDEPQNGFRIFFALMEDLSLSGTRLMADTFCPVDFSRKAEVILG